MEFRYSIKEENLKNKETKKVLMPFDIQSESIQKVSLKVDKNRINLRATYPETIGKGNETLLFITDQFLDSLIDLAKSHFGIQEAEEAYSISSDYTEFYSKELDNDGSLHLKGSFLHIRKPVENEDILFTLTKKQLSALLYDILYNYPLTVRLKYQLTTLSYSERTSKKEKRKKEAAEDVSMFIQNMDRSVKADLLLSVMESTSQNFMHKLFEPITSAVPYLDINILSELSNYQDILVDLFDSFTPVYTELLKMND